ncbi:hypothetical protein BKI52_30760 [marine bacterium AO1-C]|nr:hypothetical protein BKI52_30760 [marine bacterium AO1-C]
MTYPKLRFSPLLILGIVCLWACGSSNNTNTESTDSIIEKDTIQQTAPDITHKNLKNRKPGEIPFDFPTVSTTAKAQEYVLAPMLQWIEDGYLKGKDQMVLIFHSRKMIEPGAVESKLKSIGKEVMMPNSMIIPIPKGAKANKGDILLTWEQNRGASMRTAIVVDSKNPTTPKIQYLDNPYQADQPADQAQPNSFVVLNQPWQPGTYLAVKSNFGYDYVQVVRVADEKVLTVGFTGKIKVYNKTDCVPVPIILDVKPGDKVQVVKIASFRNGIVKKVFPDIGRVAVEIEFGGQPQTLVVGYGKVTKGLIVD